MFDTESGDAFPNSLITPRIGLAPLPKKQKESILMSWLSFGSAVKIGLELVALRIAFSP
ncbi:hypothetical protein SS37A_35630 (plasmid) [Methylocystis iwaonis]|uniref:Uncharacterized protein n=1 Tax=Methylocystis iwaonis TaxID=2885079 RepID=A0ABN6VJY4_9HYPH|nr:hypothetical protein SS37A_35630 [Methylocystis iwaonis]